MLGETGRDHDPNVLKHLREHIHFLERPQHGTAILKHTLCPNLQIVHRLRGRLALGGRVFYLDSAFGQQLAKENTLTFQHTLQIQKHREQEPSGGAGSGLCPTDPSEFHLSLQLFLVH